MKSHFRRYRRDALRRGQFWDLEFDDYRDLVLQNCYICEAPPSNRNTLRSMNGSKSYKTSDTVLLTNGLDRVDNTRGYVVNNVAPCCARCNRRKGNLSVRDLEVFLEQIRKALLRLQRDGKILSRLSKKRAPLRRRPRWPGTGRTFGRPRAKLRA